jgi:hypothetical protein
MPSFFDNVCAALDLLHYRVPLYTGAKYNHVTHTRWLVVIHCGVYHSVSENAGDMTGKCFQSTFHRHLRTFLNQSLGCDVRSGANS